jgi:hypothetical protein
MDYSIAAHKRTPDVELHAHQTRRAFDIACYEEEATGEKGLQVGNQLGR